MPEPVADVSPATPSLTTDPPSSPDASGLSSLLDLGASTAGGRNTGTWDAPAPEALAGLLPGIAIDALIGRGAMGAVYRGRQLALDRPVAVKLLPEQVGRDPVLAERFAREAKALARLRHPHIVAVHDVCQAGPWPCLVLELVEGATLRQVLTTGGLSPAAVLALVPPLCSALAHAHAAGVVHRDLKPENILLDHEGRPLLADFGLAKLGGSDGLTASGDLLGTAHYLAPEQVAGLATVDHRADLYALGVVLYELLTGHLPIGRFDPPSDHGADRRLDAIIHRALERDPARRFQSAQELRKAVEVVLMGPSVSATPVSGSTIDPAASPRDPQVGGGFRLALGSWWLRIDRGGMRWGGAGTPSRPTAVGPQRGLPVESSSEISSERTSTAGAQAEGTQRPVPNPHVIIVGNSQPEPDLIRAGWGFLIMGAIGLLPLLYLTIALAVTGGVLSSYPRIVPLTGIVLAPIMAGPLLFGALAMLGSVIVMVSGICLLSQRLPALVWPGLVVLCLGLLSLALGSLVGFLVAAVLTLLFIVPVFDASARHRHFADAPTGLETSWHLLKTGSVVIGGFCLVLLLVLNLTLFAYSFRFPSPSLMGPALAGLLLGALLFVWRTRRWPGTRPSDTWNLMAWLLAGFFVLSMALTWAYIGGVRAGYFPRVLPFPHYYK